MARVTWKSKIGFIFAAAGSAVGLANIWRFPYIVGKYGGAAFICVYLACLLLIGLPVFISEVLIGRTAQKNPRSAFKELGKNKFWAGSGTFTIITGFLISSFYSVVAGWVLGYLVSAIFGQISHFTSADQAQNFFINLVSNPVWAVGFHLFFMCLCFFLLVAGVRKGLERGSEIMVPFLLFILIALVICGVTMPGSHVGLSFYLKPDWSLITPTTFLFALGHAFFTLSLGQGTMVTYGSYLGKKDSILNNCLPVAFIDTLIALLAGLAIFPIVFAVGLKPDAGEPLVFYTLPLVFSQLKGGYILALLFFLLLTLAALTSQISAMEPLIAYLIDEKKWKRSTSVITVAMGAFLFGVPAAFSNSIDPRFTLFGMNFFDLISYVVLEIMVPLGGFLAIILLAWKWGMKKAYKAIKAGPSNFWVDNAFMKGYLWVTIKYVAPILIGIIFLQSFIRR
ncbi:MAG: hypothetical protein S4CHLAM6_05650 [Chlamydiae bacterium]|nr:hypothetical protein [Chlamydiota bacterium]